MWLHGHDSQEDFSFFTYFLSVRTFPLHTNWTGLDLPWFNQKKKSLIAVKMQYFNVCILSQSPKIFYTFVIYILHEKRIKNNTKTKQSDTMNTGYHFLGKFITPPYSKLYFRLLRDLLAFEARTIALALEFVIIQSLSARRWCCLAFLARLGAKRVSLSTKANLNFSAMDNSLGLKRDEGMTLGVNRDTAHVVGSISLTKRSSNVVSGNASWGTSNPLNLKGDGLGFTTIRGHSVDNISNESLSIFGCK